MPIVWLAVLVCWAWATGAAAGADPIHFAAAFDFDSITSYYEEHEHTLRGIDAAVAEANAAGGIHGRPVVVHTQDQTMTNVTARRLEFVRRPVVLNATAIVGSDFELEAPVVQMVLSGTPLVGPTTINPVFFAGGAAAHRSFHVRQRVLSEAQQLVNFGIRGRPQCYQFMVGVMPYYSIPAAFDDFKKTLAAAGLPAPHSVEFRFGQNHSRMILEALEAADPTPQCLVFLTRVDSMVDSLAAIARSRFRGKLTVLATSFTSLTRWPSSFPSGTHPELENVYHTSTGPHPSDTRYDVVQRYRAAIDYLDSRPELRRPGAVVLQDRHSTSSVLGYITGRLALDVLGGMVPGNYSKAAFHAAVLKRRLIAVDDYVLGPYTGPCSGQQSSDTGACDCNVGGRRMFITRLNATTARADPVDDDAARLETDVASVTVPWAQCGFDASSVRRVAHALAVRDTTATPPGTSVMQTAATVTSTVAVASFAARNRLLQGWENELFRIRARGSGGEAFTPVIETVTRATEADAFRWAERYALRAVVGSHPPPLNPFRRAGLETPRLSYAHSAGLPERDPPTVPFAAWDPASIPVLPVLADYLQAAVAFAVARGHTAVHVVVDTASAADLARRSLHTFGIADAASVVVVSATSAPAAPPNGVWLVATQHPAVLARVLTAVSTPQAGLTSVFATSEGVLETSGIGDPGLSSRQDVVFVTALRSFSSGAAVSYGRLLAQAIVEVSAAIEQHTDPTHTTPRIAGLYRGGAVLTASGTLSPLSDASCELSEPVWPHPGRACQCSKGLNAFHIRPLFDWNTTAAPVFTHRHRYCGVEYKPLPSSSLPTLVIAAIAVGAAIVAAVGGAAVFLYCTVRGKARDNRNAPKNSDEPFAMVFTDIQASTTLWAHAPQHMGEAIDTHHRLIRDLIKEHKGYEVKTIGDSFMVAFHNACAATRFALGLQETLYDHRWGTSVFDDVYREIAADAASDTWSALSPATPGVKPAPFGYDDCWRGIRVRVGVHFGTGSITVDETTKGYDYYGTVVNTAARVEGVAHGGQVLLTGAAFSALDGDAEFLAAFSKDITVTDLGPQPLRGLADPVPLLQLLAARFDGRTFPPLRLDKENAVEASSSPTDTGDPVPRSREHSSSSEAHAVTVADFVARVAKAHRVAAPPAVAQLVFRAVEVMLSTSSSSFRASTLLHVADKWRVPKATPRWMGHYLGQLEAQRLAKAQDTRLLAQTVARVLAALDKVTPGGVADYVQRAAAPATRGTETEGTASTTAFRPSVVGGAYLAQSQSGTDDDGRDPHQQIDSTGASPTEQAAVGPCRSSPGHAAPVLPHSP